MDCTRSGRLRGKKKILLNGGMEFSLTSDSPLVHGEEYWDLFVINLFRTTIFTNFELSNSAA